jgi:hypothetical protein
MIQRRQGGNRTIYLGHFAPKNSHKCSNSMLSRPGSPQPIEVLKGLIHKAQVIPHFANHLGEQTAAFLFLVALNRPHPVSKSPKPVSSSGNHSLHADAKADAHTISIGWTP